MIEAIIFDIDGVLINSIDAAYRVKTKILQDHGVDIRAVPDPDDEGHKGTSLANLLRAVEKHQGVVMDFEKLKGKVSSMVHEDLKSNNITIEPELLRFLHDLKDRKIPLAVATSSVKQASDNKLNLLGITDLFDVIITADDVDDHKPHPASYLAAIEKLGVSPANTVIFEDSTAGVTAGLAAGATVIGVSIHNPDKTPLPGVVRTIDGWDEISYEDISKLFVDAQ